MPPPTFEPSAEQRAVIDHRGGHLQVIACAGAGKTEAISRRVSSLIEEGVEPNQIIAFTFTERAATGLKHRITKRIAETKGEKFLDRLGPVQLCVVADDDQAIYQWRGSDVSNMQEFTKRYKSVTSLSLSVNRRSRPQIISTANAFAESIKPRLPKKMVPHREAGGPEVHCWAAETIADEATVIADTVERQVKRASDTRTSRSSFAPCAPRRRH